MQNSSARRRRRIRSRIWSTSSTQRENKDRGFPAGQARAVRHVMLASCLRPRPRGFGISLLTGRGMIGHSLSVQNVTKRFGHLTAIDGISFDVRPREFISVIGPSGCGKSTLFNIIGGFVGDYEGTLLVDGQAKVAR